MENVIFITVHKESGSMVQSLIHVDSEEALRHLVAGTEAANNAVPTYQFIIINYGPLQES